MVQVEDGGILHRVQGRVETGSGWFGSYQMTGKVEL